VPGVSGYSVCTCHTGASVDARRGDSKAAAVLLHDALADEHAQTTALPCLQLVGVELHALPADARHLSVIVHSV
jgi:hypothetical protein